MLYNNGVDGKDMWTKLTETLSKKKNKRHHMKLMKFYAGDRFGLWIDLRTMPDQNLNDGCTRLVNAQDTVQLEMPRSASCSGNFMYHIYEVAGLTNEHRTFRSMH